MNNLCGILNVYLFNKIGPIIVVIYYFRKRKQALKGNTIFARTTGSGSEKRAVRALGHGLKGTVFYNTLAGPCGGPPV